MAIWSMGPPLYSPRKRSAVDVYKRQQVIGSKFVLYLQKKKDSAYADLLK